MPRKIRQLKSDLKKAGFMEIKGRGKGSHSMWEHPWVPGVTVTIGGRDGDDARQYQEQQVRDAIVRTQAGPGPD